MAPKRKSEASAKKQASKTPKASKATSKNTSKKTPAKKSVKKSIKKSKKPKKESVSSSERESETDESESDSEEVEAETKEDGGKEIAWEWVGGRKGRDTLLVGSIKDESNRAVTKIAGFDVDGTLIETKSGETFAKNKNDWKWKSKSVISRVQELWKNGYHIVIFTNQGGVQGEGRAATKAQQADRVQSLCGRLASVACSLGVPILILAATASDMYRKPMTGMWNVMVERLQTLQKTPMEISMKDSIFVGDAAGRRKGWMKGAPADFSCTDRKFAYNLGISFQTPEECFDKVPSVPLAKIDMGESPIDWIPKEDERVAIDKANGEKIKQTTGELEVVICVGMPGAGKSSACKGRLPGHVWINQDTLGSADRCAGLVRSNLNEKKSVVVDCTNPSVDHRRMYIRIATEKKASARILHFNTPKIIAEHLNILREVTSKGERSRVPQIAYRQYLSQFACPTKELDKVPVSTIEFCPIFDSEEARKVFTTFTS